MPDPYSPGRLAEEARALGVPLPPESTHPDLLAHLRLLYAWNRRFNLTAIRDPGEGMRRHLLEALVALPELPREGRAVALADLGSGNGYPALPLVISRGELRATLFEASARKVDFLRAAARASRCLDRVEVIHRRLEKIEQLPEQASVITLRAFPEPIAWIEAAASRAATRRVLAWVSARTAVAAAARLAGTGVEARRLPLPTHRGAVLLSVRSGPANGK